MSDRPECHGDYRIRLLVRELPDHAWLATSENLPGLVAEADTREEVIEAAREVAKALLDSYCERGDPLPAGIRKDPSQVEIELAV